MPFANRADAGRQLARRLLPWRRHDVVVLGLPRGGVPVAFEVAQALQAPLDVIIVRKLGVPFQPELAMGAIGEGPTRVVDADVVRAARVTDDEFAAVEARERAELERRAERLRGDRPRIPLAGRTAIIVDDGLATGSTARVAGQVARAAGAAQVVVAVPVGPPGSVAALRTAADDVVCLERPSSFVAIGQWYDDFSPTPEDEVVSLLARAAPTAPGPGASTSAPPATAEGGAPC
ncbi:MAG TPA: phosphoribosyltransferase family protein [Acidimicrobiales bacterium]|nr:phosphoribosyltransferase family protein [Acidimicrobiales bacterium]